MFRRPLTATVLLTAMAVAVAACGGPMAGPVPAGAAATVNGTEVSADLLDRLVTAVAPSSDDAPEGSGEDAQRQILTSLVRSQIVVDFAAERGVELDAAGMQALVDDAQEDVAAQAEEFGITEQEYAELILAPTELLELVRAESVDTVDQAELEAALEEAEAAGRRGAATLSHILVATEEEAEDARARIEAGESFAEVAADVSTDGSAAQGGSLGEAVPLDNFVAEFADAAAEAPEGEVVGPVQTEFGYHLIKVDEHISLEQSLREELAAQALQPALDQAFQEADVTVASRYGEWSAQDRAVVASELPGDAPTPSGGDVGATASEGATEGS